MDYASAIRNSGSVIDRQEKCIDIKNGGEMSGDTVQLLIDHLKIIESTSCGNPMNVVDRQEKVQEDKEVTSVIDATRITLDTMKQPNEKDILNRRKDNDHLFAVVPDQEEDDDDPYAELDMYLEKVKVC